MTLLNMYGDDVAMEAMTLLLSPFVVVDYLWKYHDMMYVIITLIDMMKVMLKHNRCEDR